jgi:hypothetical protein
MSVTEPVLPLCAQDSNPAAFSPRELLDIFAIWRGVSEDFAAFDVDVTTEDPGKAVLMSRGIRVCIGGAGECEWGW